MKNIAKFFIENYKFTYVLTFFFIFFGYGGLTSTNSEAFPKVNLGQVIISTIYQGATAEDIESKITKPIEDQIRSITGIKEVKSISQPGESRILTIVDVDNYDVEKVIADLQRAVDRVPDLPVDLQNPPNFLEVKTDEFPVIEVAIIGKNTDRLRDRVAVEIEEDFEDNDKISTIRRTGFRERQFNIYLDKKKLNRLHVGLSEINRAIGAANVAIPGGALESKDGVRTLVKIDGKMRTVEDLGKIVIRANFSGSKVLLKDVAKVVDGEEDARTLALFEGEPATFLVISKKSGPDIVDLASEVKERLKYFQAKYEGKLKFQIYNDEGIRVENRLDVLKSNGVAGLILVVFFLMLFLPGRIGIMASLSLPLAIFATFGYMQVSGYSLNTITILAMVISIGMLVDNAVVIAENFVRLTDEGYPHKFAATESIRTLWLPISATAMTTIAAFLPMLVTKGILGQFIRGIPIIVTASLLISLIECFILLPMRLVKNRDDNGEDKKRSFENSKKDWFAKRIIPGFTGFVRRLVRYRYISAIGFLGLIAFAIFMMVVGNKFVLFPADQTERYLGRLELQRGIPIEKTKEALAEISRSLREELGDDAAYITASAGVAEQDPNDPKGKRGQNVGLISIMMTEAAKNNLKTNSVLKRMRTIKYEGAVDLTFEAYINGPPVGDPVTVIFRSNDPKQLEEVITKVLEKTKEVDGILDVKVDDIYGEKEVYLNVNTAKANRLGLNTSEIGQSVRTAVAGIPIANVNINNREVDYFVRLQDSDRTSEKSLLGLKIMNPRGDLIPLRKIAKLKDNDGFPYIKRFNYKPAKTITGGVNDEVITSVEANAKVLGFFNDIKDQYPDVSFKFGGEGERTQESFQSLVQALNLSLIGIFALLVFLFRSYIKPVIILTTIPLGLVGVAIAFFVHQRPISFLALIGLVGLGGIIVNSGIVLISFIEELRTSSDKSLSEILVEATGLRLRAVVVTSLTTVSGLLPTAYGIGGSDEFIIPMTLAMAWGLVSGTILALLWVPCAYAITEDISGGLSRLLKRKSPSRQDTPAEGLTS